MTLIDASGKKIECVVVAIFRDGEKNYIAYTDGSMTNGEKDLMVSKFILDGDTVRLCEITLESEWDYVQNYLDSVVFDEDDEDEI